MTFVFMLAAIIVITVIALLAVGKLGELPDTTSDRAPLALPEDRVLTTTDVDSVRFNVGARGYRMDEVDVVLDRLSAEVSERDARIAALEAALADNEVPAVDLHGNAVAHHEETEPSPWA